MKTTHFPSWAGLSAYVYFICLLGFIPEAISQAPTPIVTIRFANPSYDCLTGQYCVDVEYRSDSIGIEVFGTNVRFFYPDTILELVGFSDFQGGYGPVSPDPPMVLTSATAGPGLFTFVGPADFVNGAIQLTNPDTTPLLLDNVVWTKIFQVCFLIDDPEVDVTNFCPSLVWDLEADPTAGGFLVGDDGVVVTLVDPNMVVESVPADENVVQFNWAYMGPGTAPFGAPVETNCISIDCSIKIVCAVDTTIECDASTDPSSTGFATATDNCAGEPTITYSDTIIEGGCVNNFTIERTWYASNECNEFDTCLQIITVIDTTPPTFNCPPSLTVQCAADVPPVDTGSPTGSDNCNPIVVVGYIGDEIVNQTCANKYTVIRTYQASDGCGNTATCQQTITVNDTIPPTLNCPPDITVLCAADVPPVDTGSPTGSDNCNPIVVVGFLNDQIVNQTCANKYTVIRTYQASDGCGNTATCQQTITVNDTIPPSINCPPNLTVQCAADVPPVDTGSPTASDNCNPVVVVGFLNDQIVNQTCVNRYTVIRTYQASDGCGNSATCQQTITVNDLTPPTITCPPSITVATVEETSPTNTGTATGSDNCGETPGLNFQDVTIAGMCAVDFTIQRTWTATDACGMSATCNQTIEVIGGCCTTPPLPVIMGNVFVCPNDTSVYTILNYNASYMYNWIVMNGGMIVQNTGSSITVAWPPAPGGPFVISVTAIAGVDCDTTGTLTVFSQGADPLACIDHINLSIDNECGTVVTSGMILTGDQAGDNSYTVVIMDLDGNIIPNATFTFEHIGKTFKVSVQSLCSGQSCWGFVTVEDKFPPVIDCVCPVGNTDSLCNVNCLAIPGIIEGHIPEGLEPEVIDNCGGATLEIINTVVNFDYCVDGTAEVTWKATDASGNMSTCLQVFHIVPLTLDSLTFPPNYEGICNGSSDPSVTGWPMLDGLPLDLPGGVCNISVSYKDVIIDLCGGGIKIIRTWRVLDWCTGELSVFGQSINLPDHQGPVLTCVDELVVGTDIWFCYANVNVPKPIAVDACSKVVSYQLFTLAGTVVNSGNNFIIQELPQGTHPVTWTVSDECGNTSTCSFNITVVDNVPPVVSCQQHTVVSLTSERSNGITLVPASVFDDHSFDNCGPVSFRARRMESCIDFDWTTGGACVDEIPGGIPAVNNKDRGTDRGPCVPFGCCDVNRGPIMVELEATDEAGNVNYCMVLVDVQDKLSPNLECPPDITISCEYLLNVEEGTFVDAQGNNNGALDEDPLSALFGNMYDAFSHHPSEREDVIINDPHNTDFHQPHTWGIDGWATDNCEVSLQVTVRVVDDCSGASFPFSAPAGARKLIERRFLANDGSTSGSCLQRIWVVDFNPFHINDETCYNPDPNDGVIWPCDVTLTACPNNLTGTGTPTILDDACSIIGVSFEDTRYEFADSACYKVLREWKVIDWCQLNLNTGYGLWSYTQTIKVMDQILPVFVNCPQAPVELCIGDPGISLPANNQANLGENNPNSSSCSVHVVMSQRIHEDCSAMIFYDVKVYPFNGPSFIQMVPTTSATLNVHHDVDISFNTQQSSILSVQQNGLPYNSPLCGDYHRVVWTVEDGCGNRAICDYLFRLVDCKPPTPVCLDGLSTVIMGTQGQVTIWASDFNASSFDDCTPGDELLFSFSGTSYQPSFTYTCLNIPGIGIEFEEEIWAADGGSDQNCNGQIEWSERNKDFCTTSIVITDNNDICDQLQSMLTGQILTDQQEAVANVVVNLSGSQQLFPAYTTSNDGMFVFTNLPLGLDYTIQPERNDDYKNGVSTLDLVKIQKHLLGQEPFTSPYQYIAADANNSHNISALDLIDLRKLILGITTVLPNNDSWRFMDKNFVMADPTNPWLFDENLFIQHWQGQSSHNDFMAIKIGDVNHSVKANALQVEPRDGRRLVSIKAESKEEAQPGDIVELKLTFPEIVNGFQWTFETEGLDYVGVSSGDIQIDDSNVGILGNGIITMSWNGEVLNTGNVKQNMSMLLRWKVTSPGRIMNMIRLTSLVTPAEGYTPGGELLKLKLEYADTGASKDFALYQNKPNPWNGQTTIGFDLKEDGPAELSIFDVTGKEIARIHGDYKAGYNTIELTAKDVPSAGVMYYRLESGGYSASKKMVLIR